MRVFHTALILVISVTSAFAQATKPPTHIRWSIGAAAHPASTIVAQISGLARIPTARQTQYVIAGLNTGMVFYSRAQQKEIGAYEDKAPYVTIAGGAGFGAIALSIGFGARIEDRLRVTSGIETSVSWMHTFGAYAFVTDNIGVRLEYVGPRWVLVGVEVGL